uniref:Uncharacterized protein n=1 Tax=Anguilla anguilla TaxID=7936 RepID=A0A0E9RL03_ANGAN
MCFIDNVLEFPGLYHVSFYYNLQHCSIPEICLSVKAMQADLQGVL